MTESQGVTLPQFEETEMKSLFDPSKHKKKSKQQRSRRRFFPAEGIGAAVATFADDVQDGEDDPSYEQMLDKLYSALQANNPQLTTRARKKLKPPQVTRVGSTRTAWTNFKETCDSLKREPTHLQQFFLTELGTTGSIDGNNRFVIKGKYQAKYMESLLRKYIGEYVTCHMCRSLDTELTRDNITRLYFMKCKACGSNRSVAAIRTGFQAVARGARRRARMAAQS